MILHHRRETVIISIVGPPSSGKSFFLTTMLWELRNILGPVFGYSITDSDPVCNKTLIEYEDTFFYNSNQDEIVTLRKTEEQGELYNEVRLGESFFQLPTPFFFNVKSLGHASGNHRITEKTFVLYDNAGESFQPGKDITLNLSTQHLAHSDIIFFMFDPLQDPQASQALAAVDAATLPGINHFCRQDVYLAELINRLRKYNSSYRNLFDKTLIVVVPKFDTWQGLLPRDIPDHPWQVGDDGMAELDYNQICSVSLLVRNFIERFNPAVVHSAESFFANVLYLPVSAIGRESKLQNLPGGGVGVRVADIAPYWITVPFLHAMLEHRMLNAAPAVIADDKCQMIPAAAHAGGYSCSFGGKNYRLSGFYLNRRLQCPESGDYFIITDQSQAGQSLDLDKTYVARDSIDELLDEL